MPSEQTTKLLNVLLVEDNDDDATWAMEALEEEGVRCSVSRVEDGEDALAFLRKVGTHAAAPQPALMLLDLSLPKKDGLVLLQEIREADDPVFRKLPVVIMTISKDFGDAQKAANLGVIKFISKPVKLGELVEAVRSILPDPDLHDEHRRLLNDWAGEMERFG